MIHPWRRWCSSAPIRLTPEMDRKKNRSTTQLVFLGCVLYTLVLRTGQITIMNSGMNQIEHRWAPLCSLGRCLGRCVAPNTAKRWSVCHHVSHKPGHESGYDYDCIPSVHHIKLDHMYPWPMRPIDRVWPHLGRLIPDFRIERMIDVLGTMRYVIIMGYKLWDVNLTYL